MRTDYVLYVVAVICFILAGYSAAYPFTEATANMLIVAVLAIIGVIFVLGGYSLRPRRPVAKTAEPSMPPTKPAIEEEQPAAPAPEPETMPSPEITEETKTEELPPPEAPPETPAEALPETPVETKKPVRKRRERRKT